MRAHLCGEFLRGFPDILLPPHIPNAKTALQAESVPLYQSFQPIGGVSASLSPTTSLKVRAPLPFSLEA